MKWSKKGMSTTRKPHLATPRVEALEERACPAHFSVYGATGSPDTILSVKVLDGQGQFAASVQPFNNLTSIRVATGDFNGDGAVGEVAVIGRRTGGDLRGEIVTYDINNTSGVLTEVSRFDAFGAGILGNGFIATGDFDGDGDDDIAVAQINDFTAVVTLQLHLSNGDGTFTTGASSQIDFGVISAPRIAAGDTDNDGFDEIVIAARTPAGADVRVFDADTGTPALSGNFIWTFGIAGYSRGAFVSVGDYDFSTDGEEIVLGSNVGGMGRVDVVNFADTSDDPVFDEATDRFQPFGPTYNAAVRVAFSQKMRLTSGGDGPILETSILCGQDRFQDGQAIFARRDFDITTNPQNVLPPFTLGTTLQVFTAADGSGPANQSATGNTTLGPFVSFANPTLVAPKGGRVAFQQNDLTTPTGTGNMIPGDGTTVAFTIDNSRLQVPTGFNFVDPDNAMYVFVNVAAPSMGVLDNLQLSIEFYSDANISAEPAGLVAAGTIDPTALFFTSQFGDTANQAVPGATPVNDQVFGFFLPTNVPGPLSDFFDGSVAATTLGTAGSFWSLVAFNDSGEDITLVDWELYFDFDG